MERDARMETTLRPRACFGGVSPAVTQRQEEELWRRVVRDVRENPQKNQSEKEEKRGAKVKIEEGRGKTKKIGENVVESVESVEQAARAVAEQGGEGARGGGLDKRNARRLRRGEMAIEDRIDLHGLTRGEARGDLCMRLRRCYDRGFRCVLVISGKGRGILREEVMAVLDSEEVRNIVVKHCEAQVKDGGEGARYVLLRRKRK